MNPSKKYVLAINCPLLDGEYTYDGNASLFENGRLIAAIAEERVTRKKYDGNFAASVQYLLEHWQVNPENIEAVAIVSFAKPILSHGNETGPLIDQALSVIPVSRDRVFYLQSHHEAHALAAVALSPFDRCIVGIFDNTGNIIGERTSSVLADHAIEQTSFYLFENGILRLVKQMHEKAGDVGFGRLYSKVTRYIGYKSYQEAGKTMGLSSFGRLGLFDNTTLYYRNETGWHTDLTHATHSEDGLEDLRYWFAEQGKFLPPASQLGPNDSIKSELAGWVQQNLQQTVDSIVEELMTKYETRNICLAGGVALNSVMNSFISTPGRQVFIPSSPGDAGISIGAGIGYYREKTGVIPRCSASPYLGREYTDEETDEAIRSFGDKITATPSPAPWKEAADLLAENEFVFWFQGRSEFGPRALGNRSILANPLNPWTKDVLNHQLKKREWHRPFAPSILEEHVPEYFDFEGKAPYMMQVARAKPQACTKFPACIHVDGTARLHTVDRLTNPRFYDLISTFFHRTGIPVVLNTSFNLDGMAIVETPADAIRCFLSSDIVSYLFINNRVITKTKNQHVHAKTDRESAQSK